MGKICLKCDTKIPNTKWIDGKLRSLTKRKYCLNCSPFGQHNTVSLKIEEQIKNCKNCGSKFTNKKQSICAVCQYKKRWNNRKNQVYNIVGTACWLCSYDKGIQGTAALDFHHVNPLLKKFNVSRREIAGLRWDKIWEEMQKCVLLCCRCHRE